MIDPIVSIGVVTYNQKEYISECLNSLISQYTNFEYEIVVSDDCSVDGTQDVLLKYQSQYPDMIRLNINSKNLGVAENYRILFHLFRGKYVMLCEGDDYWINPLKIEHQISFMESNNDYGFTSGKTFRKTDDVYTNRKGIDKYHLYNELIYNKLYGGGKTLWSNTY